MVDYENSSVFDMHAGIVELSNFPTHAIFKIYSRRQNNLVFKQRKKKRMMDFLCSLLIDGELTCTEGSKDFSLCRKVELLSAQVAGISNQPLVALLDKLNTTLHETMARLDEVRVEEIKVLSRQVNSSTEMLLKANAGQQIQLTMLDEKYRDIRNNLSGLAGVSSGLKVRVTKGHSAYL